MGEMHFIGKMYLIEIIRLYQTLFLRMKCKEEKK